MPWTPKTAKFFVPAGASFSMFVATFLIYWQQVSFYHYYYCLFDFQQFFFLKKTNLLISKNENSLKHRII